ncbi:MAG: hypothetical protein IIB14_09365 [Chloroflexi bacterium]|nr:hypothetical protein [Chloroflexota bacterium]
MSNTRPDEFEKYWKETLEELSGTPVNPENPVQGDQDPPRPAADAPSTP